MPPLLAVLADIPFLIEGALGPGLATTSALAGLAGTGVGLANTLGGPPKPTVPGVPPPTPPNPQALAQQNSLIARQDPNLQASGSGELSPQYRALVDQILAGVFGQPGAAGGANAVTGGAPGAGQGVQQNFSLANSQPTNAAVTGNPLQLSDFVNNFTGGQ